MYSNELICKILIYINNNINKEITIDELASTFFYNRTYIMKKFKKEIGITIFDYINSIRIYNSTLLYRNDNYILGIAFKNGFQSLEYYSETFKKYIGVSPKIYKKYLLYTPDLSETSEQLIRNNFLKLIILKSKVAKYLDKRKVNVEKVRSYKL